MQWLKMVSLAALAIVSLTGCKIWVVSPPGGDVLLGDPLNLLRCQGGNVCEIEVDDPSFNRTFTAVPKAGYEFVRWLDAPGHGCRGSTDPACIVSLPGGAFGQAVVDTYEILSLTPVYRDVGIDSDNDGIRDEEDEDDDNDGVFDVDDDCPLAAGTTANGCNPITDFVVINGQDWAQLNVFVGLTWNDFNAVCPGGVCGGSLNGYDMTGWRWASVDELNTLFNTYVPSEFALGPGPDSYTSTFTFMQSFYNTGLSPTSEQFRLRIGWEYRWRAWTSSESAAAPLEASTGEAQHCACGFILGDDIADTAQTAAKTSNIYSRAWLFRP